MTKSASSSFYVLLASVGYRSSKLFFLLSFLKHSCFPEKRNVFYLAYFLRNETPREISCDRVKLQERIKLDRRQVFEKFTVCKSTLLNKTFV